MQLLLRREKAIEADLMKIELGRVAQSVGLRRVAIRFRAHGRVAPAPGGIALKPLRGTKRRRHGIGEVATGPIRMEFVFWGA
jgi:hypothetical protein